MQKELIISTTPQETKVAVLEDEELVEFYIERYRSKGIAGNIYKGKVTKVLPGMQSAFVDIGLERDAFLYVSDFFEDTEEYEKIVSTVEEEVAQLAEGAPHAPVAPPVAEPPVAEPKEVPALEAEAPRSPVEPRQISTPIPAPADEKEIFDRRGRRRDRDRRGKKPKIPSFEAPSYDERPGDRMYGSIEVLPGESLAKYARKTETESKTEPEPAPQLSASEIELAVEVREEQAIEKAAESETAVNAAAQPALEKDEAASELSAAASSAEDTALSPLSAGGAPQSFESGAARALDFPPQTAPVPPEVTEGGVVTEASARPHTHESSSEPPAREQEKEEPSGESEAGPEGRPSATARITDRADNQRFAHRSTRSRQRRRSGPVSPRTEEHLTNGHSLRSGPMISELLREGQEILVQVSKEPLGKKGARITSHIALPGRYLVYMPTVDHVGVSRKIASDEERMRLKRTIQEHRAGLPGGFIVRTAAEGRSEDDFVQDIRFLGNLWTDIRSRSDKKPAPMLIHRDLNLVQRVLRDQLSPEHKAIRLDNEQEYAMVLDFVNKFQPALVNRVKLHVKDTPIFEEFALNVEIDKALRPKVWLKSGGYIVINQTEALVAIDVNTGKFVGKSNRLEDTIVRTNLDAVHEIVRQVRLRNLGGIIVVDFIDMEEKKNRQRVMAALEEAIRADRSPSKILQFNDFGLVAITRKRTQPSLERTLCVPCSYCTGSGWTKSPETICYEIQQEIRKMANVLEGKEITVRVHPEVAKVLKGGEYVSIQEMEEWVKKDVVVKSDPLLHEEHFDIF